MGFFVQSNGETWLHLKLDKDFINVSIQLNIFFYLMWKFAVLLLQPEACDPYPLISILC